MGFESRPALTYLPYGVLLTLFATGSIRTHFDALEAPSARSLAGEPTTPEKPPAAEELQGKLSRVIADAFQVREVRPIAGGYFRIDVETAKGIGHLVMAPDRRFFIAGNLLDSAAPERPDNRPVLPPPAATQLLKPHAEAVSDHSAKGKLLFDFVRERAAVIQGTGRRELFVFFDPLCGVCHTFYKLLATDWIAKHDLKVHWLPVVVLPGAESQKRAQFIADALLRGDDEVAAKVFAASMTGKDSGIPASWTSNDAALGQVRDNTEALLDAIDGIDGAGTPTVLYKTVGGETRLIGWLPPESAFVEIGL